VPQMQDSGAPPAALLQAIVRAHLRLLTHAHTHPLTSTPNPPRPRQAPNMELGPDGLPKVPGLEGGDACPVM
jgi:hypothetical protein